MVRYGSESKVPNKNQVDQAIFSVKRAPCAPGQEEDHAAYPSDGAGQEWPQWLAWG